MSASPDYAVAYTGDRYIQPLGASPLSWLSDLPQLEWRYPAPTYDRHVRRSGEDYAAGLTLLHPEGQAWPSWDAESNYSRWLDGIAQVWGEVDSRAADLLERESDPRSTIELLPDWERAWGLPDECLAEPLTISDRQRMLVARITLLGGQSRQFFLDFAHFIRLGVQIVEHSPFQCGISHVGDTRNLTDSGWYRWEIGPPTIRFYWTVGPYDVRLTWFRCGAGQCGVDPHVRIGIFSDLECIWTRLKPAHTQIAFDYGGLNPIGRYQGTP